MTFGTVTQAVTDGTLEDRNDDRKAGKSDSAYRTISEVAQDLNLPQHVLRFWESKFKQISPLKRGGGRRYYRPQDIDLIKRIHFLLHTQGYTIKGVQKLLVKDRQLVGSMTTAGQENAAPAMTSAPSQQQQAPVSPVAADTIQRIAQNTHLPVNASVSQNTSGASTTNSNDLKLILNRLKTLRTQISERC